MEDATLIAAVNFLMFEDHVVIDSVEFSDTEPNDVERIWLIFIWGMKLLKLQTDRRKEFEMFRDDAAFDSFNEWEFCILNVCLKDCVVNNSIECVIYWFLIDEPLEAG